MFDFGQIKIPKFNTFAIGEEWDQGVRPSEFRSELTKLLNRTGKENGSNTPDFILAQFIENIIIAFDFTLQQRDKWHGVPDAMSLKNASDYYGSINRGE